jgi:hypothetical protein
MFADSKTLGSTCRGFFISCSMLGASVERERLYGAYGLCAVSQLQLSKRHMKVHGLLHD